MSKFWVYLVQLEGVKPTNRQTHKLIRYRRYKKMDLAQFKSDLKNSELITNPENNVTDLYNQNHNVLSDLVVTHSSLLRLALHIPETLGLHLGLWTQNKGRDSWNVCGAGLDQTLTEVGSTPKSIHATDLCLRLNLFITPNWSVTSKQIPKSCGINYRKKIFSTPRLLP